MTHLPTRWMQVWSQDESGYTLVEVAVSVMLVLLLGGLCYTVYVEASRWVEPWRREVLLENQAHLALQRLASDLRMAHQFAAAEDGRRWVLTYPSGPAVTYHLHDGVLTRNGLRVVDSELDVTELTLTPSRASLLYAPRGPSTVAAHVPERIAIRVAVQSPDRTLTLQARVALRRHRPWPPIP